MNIRRHKSNRPVWLGALALGTLLLVAFWSPADESNTNGIGTNVKFPDYYEFPNQNKLRTLVRGSSVVPLGKNRYRVKDVHIESFRLTGEAEAVVDAPDCTYDHGTHVANSDGRIKAKTADGQFQIEGIGFILTITNKSLMISNHTGTVIRDLGLTPKTP